MIAASFGLLITRVDKSMNSTTFQCFMSTGIIFELKESPIGTLMVEETPSGNTIAINCIHY